MNEAIVERWNEVVTPNDEAYVLGDLMLNDNAAGLEYLSRLNGTIYVIRGNHDTDNRIELYNNHPKIAGVFDAKYLRYNGYHFYLTHYPCLTGNLEKESLKACTLNLYGHTHQRDNFYEDRPYMYHVGVDSHDCRPVSIDQIIEDMRAKVAECLKML